MALKEITRLTGGLHEAQLLQLKMWGLGLFSSHTSPKTLQIKCNIDTKTINFNIDTPKKPPKDYSMRISLIKAWVQALLGSEWKVIVKDVRNNRTIRKGRKAKKDRKIPNAKRNKRV